jgi:hypothetical protein
MRTVGALELRQHDHHFAPGEIAARRPSLPVPPVVGCPRMTNVLLVGPWAPSALAFTRSMHRQGIRVYLLQASGQGDTPRSCPTLTGSLTLPEGLVETEEGIDLISRYAHEVGASALVATVDRELIWLATHRDRFEPSCQVLAPSPESLVGILSKRHQLDLAKNAGMSVLPTHLLASVEDADAIPTSHFPLVLRPDRQGDVSPEFKVQLVKSAEQLRVAICGCRLASPLLAQPFKPFPNLLVHGARSVTGEVIATRCYLIARKFEGVSLTVEPRSFPDGLETRCRDFATLAGLTGCYHFEFLFSPAENRAHFLEVNVRLGGTTDKVVRTGFDEPALLLQAYGIAAIGPPSRGRRRRVVNKRTLLRHMMWAAKGRLTELDYPDVSRFMHIAYSCRDLVIAKDSIFDWRDVRGSIRFQLRGLVSRARNGNARWT